jgi:hypothetical protein
LRGGLSGALFGAHPEASAVKKTLADNDANGIVGRNGGFPCMKDPADCGMT